MTVIDYRPKGVNTIILFLQIEIFPQKNWIEMILHFYLAAKQYALSDQSEGL